MTHLMVNGYSIGPLPESFCQVWNDRLKWFDDCYKGFLKSYKSELKDTHPIKIYHASLVVVRNRDKLVTPEEIKLKMFQDCFVFGKGAGGRPYIPDLSTVRQYAKEAAHIIVQWEIKKKLTPKKGMTRNAVILDAIGIYVKPPTHDLSTISKAVKTKIVNYVHEKLGGQRSAIQKAVNRYFVSRGQR